MLNVDDGVGRSYYETHRRKQGVTPELLAKESLMTDRGAYLSFLEVQLERVSAACLTAQGFEERINGITEITHSSEEKVISLAKLVQLTNTCAEERSREVANAFTNVDARVKSVEVNNDARGREHLSETLTLSPSTSWFTVCWPGWAGCARSYFQGQRRMPRRGPCRTSRRCSRTG